MPAGTTPPGTGAAAGAGPGPPGTMPAAVLHGPGDLRIESRPVPAPGPTDVVVEVSHCGICGTDLHMVIEGWGRPGSIGGHEWSGTVVAAGPDVTRVRVGDAVVGGPPPGCGHCTPCVEHRPSLCVGRPQPGGTDTDGAFARYVRVDERSTVPIPPGLDLRTAALAEPLAVAMHAVSRSGVDAGDRVLVTGAGPIGALVVVASRSAGAREVVVSEPAEGRQALARRLGATVTDPTSFEIPSIAEPSRIVDEPFDVVLECSGRAPAMETGFAQLRRGGTMVLVGTGIQAPQLDPNRILLNELTVTGAFEYDPDGIAEAVAQLASGTVATRDLVEPDDVGLHGMLDAMADLAAGLVVGKVLVDPALPASPDPGGLP